MHLLQELVRQARVYMQMRRQQMPDDLEIRCDDLEAQAKKYSVYALDDFYQSEIFRSHSFEYDSASRMIIRRF